ncbi:MAG TPA: class I SAM-dependent methyltransferase [Candidatus Limnocylindrales bacterium]
MSGADGSSRPTRREHWDERHAAGARIESPDPDPTLIQEIGGPRPGRALDLGTGDGRNALWLASQGWSVTAVDFSSVALDRARAFARARAVDVEWELADLLEWVPPTRQFDLVTLFFIHLPPDERHEVYARAARAVAPGGTLLIVAHDRSNLTDGVGGPQDPDVLFTPGEVVAELSGFTILRAAAVRRDSPNGRGPIDAVVRAVRQTG